MKTSFWKNKRVLVTGGFGFIGLHVVEALLKKGSIVSMTMNSIRKPSSLKGVRIIPSDLTVLHDCMRATAHQDIVLNLAAMDGGATFKKQFPADIFRTNVFIALNILESARRNKLERVLLMSSTNVYSNGDNFPVKEDTEYTPVGHDATFGYTWAKRCIEIAAKAYSTQYGLKIAIARPSNVYGPGDYYGTDKERVITSFIRQALEHTPVRLLDNGIQKKQFIYITDLVNALLLLTETYSVCDPVNIAGSEVISIKNLATCIHSIANNKECVVPIDSQPSHRVIDLTKLLKKIRFVPEVLLKQGLEQTVRFYKEQ